MNSRQRIFGNLHQIGCFNKGGGEGVEQFRLLSAAGFQCIQPRIFQRDAHMGGYRFAKFNFSAAKMARLIPHVHIEQANDLAFGKNGHIEKGA